LARPMDVHIPQRLNLHPNQKQIRALIFAEADQTC